MQATNLDEEAPLTADIAIIGMSGRFPKAADIEEFWDNLCSGVEGIQQLSEDEDIALRTNPGLRQHSEYVSAGGFLEGVDQFDASFFGYSAREAQVMDPQQRIFLEEAWNALERAGYDTRQYAGRIGVFAGTGMNQYFLRHVYPHAHAVSTVGSFQTMLHNEKDYLATRTAYKLGCTGASLSVQTACSTSLTAVAMACQSLLCYQNDIVLAGGISLPALEKTGYLYEQGGIASPDGHCRAFDAEALGTVPGNGAGLVVLKRLEDAQADGDFIHAVIRGSAINNDGEQKMGFTAPSIEGQAAVIAEALAQADVDAESIGYVEGHGTGTRLGDPIEVAALTKAYRLYTDRTGFCALGSVKTNIGHLDTASGVAGLIKAALVLQHKVIPPTLHYHQPNPEVDFAHSPFYVNSKQIAWPRQHQPRRAGVSSFGLGGTNVHVILEEAPARRESGPARPYQLILLSAKTPAALEKVSEKLATALSGATELKLADVAYTLHAGRRAFPCRRMLVAKTTGELVQQLAPPQRKPAAGNVEELSAVPLFLFPGQGAQYVDMGRQLYESEPVYRHWTDLCCELFQLHLGADLRHIMYSAEDAAANSEEMLQQTQIAQAAIFVTEYAMARLLMAWGIRPQAMIGHSLGEYTAAVLAGVFTLEDAIFLVAQRGRLMQSMPRGEMLSIAVDERRALEYANSSISLAAVNAPSLSVLSGTSEAIARLEMQLAAEGIEHRRLHTSHAFHSAMMEPAREAFEHIVKKIPLSPPEIPYVSSVTGTWITEEEATSPAYWAKHLRETVCFAQGVQTLLQDMNGVPVEVGPGRTLSVFVAQQPLLHKHAVHTIRHPQNQREDCQVLLQAVGQMWLEGIALDAAGIYEGQSRHRVLLPTYPFESKRHWLEGAAAGNAGAAGVDLSIIGNALEEHLTNQTELRDKEPQAVGYRSETEAKIAALWSELLGEARIEPTDNFFELGGHSLLGIRLLKRLRELFQIELPESTLYKYPTVEGLGAAVWEAMHKQHSLPQIGQADRLLPLPASWIQQRMWERERLHPGDCCTTSIGWEYEGSLDVTLLERCINELILRHEVLRTSFREDEQDRRLLQVIADPVLFLLPVIDLTHLTEEQQEQELFARAFAEESLPFDLSGPCLWRVTLYLRSDHRYAFLITAHTSILDGPSVNIFLKELGALLQLRGQGSAEPLPPLPVQFADYVQWEQSVWLGPRYDDYLTYWREKLGDIHNARLPVDRPRKSQGSISAIESFYLDRELSAALRQVSKEYGCSLYTILLTGFKIVMHTLTEAVDVVTETSFSNRTVSDVEGVMGSFVNFVLLRVSFKDDPTLKELILRTKDTVNGAIAHSELPFAKVMDELFPGWYGSERHYVQGVAFTQYEKGTSTPWPGLTTTRRVWARRAMFDLYVSVIDEGEEGIVLNAEYDTHHLNLATVQKWFTQYPWILQQMLQRPDIRLHELSLDINLPGAVSRK